MSDSDSNSGGSSGQFHHIKGSKFYQTNGNAGTDSSENQEDVVSESFPISSQKGTRFSEIFVNFKARNPSKPFPWFPKFTPEKQLPPQVRDPQPVNQSKVLVHMNEITSVVGSKQAKTYFCHSWIDIASINSVEATTSLSSFYSSNYAFADDSNHTTHVEITRPRNFPGSVTHNSPMAASFFRVFHYIGLGFPQNDGSQICVRNNGFNSTDWYPINQFGTSFPPPSLYIFDCDRAALLQPSLISLASSMGTLSNPQGGRLLWSFFACGANERLHFAESLPQNFFSCILLTPDKAVSALSTSPITDKKSFFTLLDIFTEGIALDSLPLSQFSSLFRWNPLAAGLWKRFILAQRLMTNFGIHVRSIPDLPNMSEHPLWQQFDFGLRCISIAIPSIAQISSLYRSHFLSVPTPSNTVCAMISRLILIPELADSVIHDIAVFMRKSPKNCALISPFLDSKVLCSLQIDSKLPVEMARDRSFIISGLLYAIPQSSSDFSASSSIQYIVDAVKQPNTDEECRMNFISILIALKNGTSHYRGLLGSEKLLEELLPFIFSAGIQSESRLLLSLFISLVLEAIQIDADKAGTMGVHAVSFFLLQERDRMVRCVALRILTSLMRKNAKQFNAYLMRIALRSAIDGSSLVRTFLLEAMSKFLEFNPKAFSAESKSIDDFLCTSPPFDYSSPAVTELKQILTFLSNDPNETVKVNAVRLSNSLLRPSDSVAEDSETSDFSRAFEDLTNTVFTSIFSHTDETKRTDRYPEAMICGDEMELLETFSSSSKGDSITAISFDPDYGDVAFGSSSGSLLCNGEKWALGNCSITEIIHLDSDVIAAGSSLGCIHLVKRGNEGILDSFNVGIAQPGAKTRIARMGRSSIVYTSAETDNLMAWDIEALYPTSSISLPSAASIVECTGDFLYVAMENGIVAQIDPRTNSTVRESRIHAGQNVVRIGKHNGSVYTAGECGPCVIYDGLDNPIKITPKSTRVSDFALHPTLPYAITISDKAVLLSSDLKKVSDLNWEHKAKRCCFAPEKGLVAIGSEDGFVSVWKIPH